MLESKRVEEEKIVEKALGKHGGQRTFPFHDEASFIEMITQIYPHACHIIITNLDDRDKDGSPKITLKTLRHAALQVVTTTHNHTGYSTQSLRHNTISDVYVFVEYDRATVKLFKTVYDGVF